MVGLVTYGKLIFNKSSRRNAYSAADILAQGSWSFRRGNSLILQMFVKSRDASVCSLALEWILIQNAAMLFYRVSNLMAQNPTHTTALAKPFQITRNCPPVTITMQPRAFETKGLGPVPFCNSRSSPGTMPLLRQSVSDRLGLKPAVRCLCCLCCHLERLSLLLGLCPATSFQLGCTCCSHLPANFPIRPVRLLARWS